MLDHGYDGYEDDDDDGACDADYGELPDNRKQKQQHANNTAFKTFLHLEARV